MTHVRWSGAFDDPATYALVRALDARGVTVTADHRGTVDIREIDAGRRTWLAARAARVVAADVQVVDLAVGPLAAARGTAPCAIRLPAGRLASVAELAGFGLLDDIWARTEADRDVLVAMGVPEKRVWVCPDPVTDLATDIDPLVVPGAHGTIVFAQVSEDAVGPLLALWCRTFAATDDVTLVVAPAINDAALAERAGAALEGIPDTPDVVVLETVPDAPRRAALIRASRTVVAGSDDEISLHAGLLGVPVITPGADAAAALRAVHVRPLDALAHGSRARQALAYRDLAHVAESVEARLRSLVVRPRRAARRAERPSVVLEGGVRGAHSLGGVTRELARALAARDDIDLFLRDPEPPVINVDDPLLVELLARPAPEVPDVVVRTLHPAPFDRPRARRSVQMLYWEFGPPPVDWVHAAALAIDEIWVSSSYVRQGFVDAGIAPERVAIVPLGVDATRFFPGARPADFGRTAPGYRFLFIGGLARRKGVDLLLHAYEQAFTRADDVTLVVKDFGPGGPYPADEVSAWADRLAADTSAPRVVRLTGSIGEADLPGLYTACDCLVHPYRAEAFGLTMIEAMASGRLVIAPETGAARDFMGPETAMLVPAARQEMPTLTDMDGRLLAGPPVYHEIAPDDLAAALRAAAADPGYGREIGARAADDVAANHSWRRTAEAAAQRIHAVVDELDTHGRREAA